MYWIFSKPSMNMATKVEYPREYFIELKDNEFLEIRLDVNLLSGPNSYYVEVNVVQKRSSKIYKHLKTLYGYCDAEEALREASQFISNYKKNF